MTEVGLRRGTSLTRMASSRAVTPSAGFFVLMGYLLLHRLRSVGPDSRPKPRPRRSGFEVDDRKFLAELLGRAGPSRGEEREQGPIELVGMGGVDPVRSPLDQRDFGTGNRGRRAFSADFERDDRVRIAVKDER